MIPNTMLDKPEGFLVQSESRTRCVQYHTNVVHKYMCGFTNTGVGLYTLIPIDIRLYHSITYYWIAILSNANLAPNVEVSATI